MADWQTSLPQPVAASPPVHTIASTPAVLRSLLTPATAEQLHWKPSPQRWSVAETLAHLVDIERFVIGLRVRRVAEDHLPVFVLYDQEEYYARGAYSGRDARAELASFTRLRGDSVEFLRRLSPSDWDRQGRHPDAGLVSLRQLLHLWAFHDLGHIRQIAELLRAALFWNRLGPLQHFYSVNP